MAAWHQEWAHFAALPDAVALKRLCNVLVEYRLFRQFVLDVMQDKTLRQTFPSGEGETQLSTEDLIHTVTAVPDQSHTLTLRLFEVAEVLVLTTLKNRRHSRARELADLAMDRKRAKHILDKQAGIIEPEGSRAAAEID